ncbi:hypothetical protein [Paenibacillus hexagrammi]|uniref:Uncharacterized protein n=1 Tax=Paenibacillus hexagrammi TaxID=2908839 RepID=A0ABY3SP53_9BACL|nr:hypothetical protein [Paenibacillus sp. YPD9-1]UJF35205.1 hypothetical protein L0M14_08805 [Paenibacillus sp. YPD9-1]
MREIDIDLVLKQLGIQRKEWQQWLGGQEQEDRICFGQEEEQVLPMMNAEDSLSVVVETSL